MKRALVTGASGFIGRALVPRLIAEGYDVTCVARDGSSVSTDVDVVRISSFDSVSLTGALGARKFDVIFHLMAYGVPPAQRDPKTMFRVNVAGTAALVDLAITTGVRAFVYAGSCSEYSVAPYGVRIREDHPLSTDGIYAASKAAGGLWGEAAARNTDLVFMWLRLFGVYGPGEAEHRLLPSIIARLSDDKPVSLSPGDQIRDFLYIDDVCDGLIRAADAAFARQWGPFNLCSSEPTSVKQMAIAAADALRKDRSLLNFGAIPYRPGENLWLVGDGTAFHDATGFSPAIPLRTGIDLVLASQHLASRSMSA